MLDLSISRRRWLSVGSIGALGLVDLLSRKTIAAEGSAPPKRAKACIQLFLWGGPGAQETWDLKPDAPEVTRGEFRPIQTSVQGTHICEHLPLLAARAHKYALIRSLTHTGVNHGTSSYHMLTGHIHSSPGTLRHPSPQDVPNLAASAARLLPAPARLPSCVQLPAVINDGDGLAVPGQGAGFLGSRHEPYCLLADLTQERFQVPDLALADGLDAGRLTRRMDLRQLIDERLEHLAADPSGTAVSGAYAQALDLLSSADAQRAFDLSQEADSLRERYGYHHFSQGLVLARRLIEAGVPLVTVYWNSPNNGDDQSWDTHGDQHRRMKQHLLPAFDKGVSALLDDLSERGLLDETLVTWFGEFGRTPRINGAGGRDHWGFCQSIGMAGGGIAGGLVHGSSDRDGGYPATNPVTPDDLSATILHSLGIDHSRMMNDLSGRPLPLSYGQPIQGVLA